MKGKYQPKVSLVTPIFNGVEDTIEYLQSLSKVTYQNYEIIIVDDGSTDGSSRIIRKQFPQVRLLKGDGELWWAGGTNMGVRDALDRGADYILTINNDNEVSPDFLSSLVETAIANPDGIIKSVAYDHNDRSKIRSFGGEILWWAGSIDECMGNVNLGVKTVEAPLANGNSTLIPAKIFHKIGFYDEINCPQYHSDSEFLLRARSHGFRVLVDTGSVIFNKAEKSVGRRVIEKMNFVGLVTSRRSPYYFNANYKIYKEYCPYKLFQFFLFLRYIFLFKNLMKRNIINTLRCF